MKKFLIIGLFLPLIGFGQTSEKMDSLAIPSAQEIRSASILENKVILLEKQVMALSLSNKEMSSRMLGAGSRVYDAGSWFVASVILAGMGTAGYFAVAQVVNPTVGSYVAFGICSFAVISFTVGGAKLINAGKRLDPNLGVDDTW